MSRLSYVDIIIELSELCRDIISETRYQLNYYRASVYKQETAKHITYRVEKLRLLANLMKDDVLLEAFRDHDAERSAGISAYAPGECSFSTRTGRLLAAVERHCNELAQQANFRNLDPVSKNLARNIQRHKRELLSICRQGSRQWAFFHTL